ncbi:MAG: transglycosylase SLT domain-containing protein [Burkholderiales bacterium]
MPTFFVQTMPTPTALLRTILAALTFGSALALSPLASAQAVDDEIEAALPADAQPQTPPAIPAVAAPAGDPPAAAEVVAPKSLWTRVRAGFRIDDIETPLVQSQEEWLAARPEYLRRVVERSRRYLYFIVQSIESRGMPTEIALLPIIESAYNPVAYSRAHASGIWQFIPSTGKHYGLSQDFWYDGRRDVLAATDAALDYLEKLYAQFGSWELALAAYNWGEGAVERAIAKNTAKGLPTNYLSLTMPNETRWYVPKLQAVKNIIANPERYGLTLPEVANEPYFAVVTTTRPMDVKLAAKLAEVPMEEFLSLNAGHMRPVIRANGSQSLLVPVDKVDRFQANLASHDQPFLSWQVHTVQKGEQPDGIARRYGTSLSALKEINGNRKFTPGAAVLVPARAGATASHLPDLPALPVAKMAKAPPPRKGTKLAQAGKGRTVKVAGTPATRKTAKPAAVRGKPAPQKKIVVADSAKR